VLPSVAVSCSVLPYVVVLCNAYAIVTDESPHNVCYSVLQCVAVCGSVLQCVTVCCSVLQCVAVCCSVLQYVAARCSKYAIVRDCDCLQGGEDS